MSDTASDLLHQNFQTVYAIYELTQQLRIPATELQEVAVNAAIALSHLEKTSEAFQELARQIQGVSSRLLQLRDRVQPVTESVSHQILAAFKISIQGHSFALVPPETSEPVKLLVANARAQEFDISSQHIRRALALLAHLIPEYGEWRQLLSRLWSVVLTLRILATEARGEEHDFLIAMAERIESLYARQEPMTAKWFALIDQCRQELARLSDLPRPNPTSAAHARILHAA